MAEPESVPQQRGSVSLEHTTLELARVGELDRPRLPLCVPNAPNTDSCAFYFNDKQGQSTYGWIDFLLGVGATEIKVPID
jgi:hypothetical protein